MLRILQLLKSDPVFESNNKIESDEVESPGSTVSPEQNYLDNIENEVTKDPGPQTKIPATVGEDKVVTTSERNEIMQATESQVEAKLELNYTNASWTDIRDSAGERLVYRMVEKGSELELNASPPFTILLGYSPGVTVIYNDKIFDHSGFEKENIAYFTLDNNASLETNIVSGENINQDIVNTQPQDTSQIEVGRQEAVLEYYVE
jgi:hypothetical protein